MERIKEIVKQIVPEYIQEKIREFIYKAEEEEFNNYKQKIWSDISKIYYKYDDPVQKTAF